MTEFIRVRAADGPKHEFDAPLAEVDANPDLYVIVDKNPVTTPRDPLYVDPAPKKPATKQD
ncbi:MAG: hypothetical protein ABIQ01_05650, partial [Pseudolysinimonas sp.]